MKKILRRNEGQKNSMTLEIELNFTPTTINNLNDNEIREIRSCVASSFMNAGFGVVREEPGNLFANAFAVPVVDAIGEFEREEEGNIHTIHHMFIIYRFTLPLEAGDVGFFLNNEVPRIRNTISGLNPNISFELILKYF